MTTLRAKQVAQVRAKQGVPMADEPTPAKAAPAPPVKDRAPTPAKPPARAKAVRKKGTTR